MVCRGIRRPTWHRPKEFHPGAMKRGQDGKTAKQVFTCGRKGHLCASDGYLNKLQHDQVHHCSKHFAHSLTHSLLDT